MSTETIQLPIEGMSCAGCSRSLESKLSNADGVQKVSVNFPTETAYVEYAPDVITVADLAEAVSAAGFSVKEQQATIDLKITGMTCAGCSNGVEKALQGVEGTITANVNLITEQAAVRYDPDKTNPDALTQAVDAKGFGAQDSRHEHQTRAVTTSHPHRPF